MTRVAARLALAVALLTSAPATAQRPTAGLRQATQNVAAGEHVDNAADNPAALGLGGDFDFTLSFLGTPRETLGTGTGAFAGIGVLDPYHMGLSVQLLDVPGRQTHEPVKLTWAHALRLSAAFSLGFSWSTFTADDDSALGGVSTFDAGVVWRPARWLAAGVAATDIGTPLYRGEPIERGWDVGLALRPGTERFTLSGAARFEETDGADSTYGGRLDWNFWGPLSLLGRYDTTTADGSRSHTVLAGLGYQIAARVGVGVFGYAPDTNAEQSNVGMGTLVRVGTNAEPQVRPQIWHTIVEVGLSGEIPEFAAPGFFESKPKTPFLDTLTRLRALGEDDRVDAILLSITDLQIGWAQAEELRSVISEVRAAGRSVFAYLPVGDTRSYYVATACDRIFTSPAGGLLLTGIRADFYYLRALLEKLGVQAQFVAIGDYKSAPEMFMRDGPSEPAREAENALLDPLYDRLVQAIAAARRKTPEQVAAIIDAGPYTAKGAHAAGLVDGIVQYDEFEQVFTQVYGARLRFVAPEVVLERRDARWGELPRIGVLYAVGTITDGESVSNPFTGTISTGADTFIQSVRELRETSAVEAVVLRIDSPGGSVTASDVMWRELKLLAKEKPVFVSMGNVAASGGYYIAAAGEEILAGPSTITGSIGIFTGKFDVTGLLAMLGIRSETFRRGARADFLGVLRPWNDAELQTVRASMEELYQLFLQRVVEGRKSLTTAQVDALGRGRVWLGSQARERGLVDAEGGLLTVIERVATRAGLARGDYVLEAWPEGGGFGGLPRSPVLAPPALVARWLGGDAATASGPLPRVLRALLDLPLLHFESGDALALLPFVTTLER
jgi:protease-4